MRQYRISRPAMPPPSLTMRRAARHPGFAAKLRRLALPLSCLVQVNTGRVHAAFPRNFLQYHLLTEDQLDDLAHFYHQRTPGVWTRCYPCPVSWSPSLTLEEKRRKLGKFIGLRGCNTPMGRESALEPTSEPTSESESESALESASESASESGPQLEPVLETDLQVFLQDVLLQDAINGDSEADEISRLSPLPSPVSASSALCSPPPLPASPFYARLPLRPLTVEEVLEAAHRARLAEESEDAMRRKLGFYR